MGGPPGAWKDVQAVLAAASAEMKLGELVHTETFSLFDGMSAVEIMEPRMDAGMDVNGFRTLEELFAAGLAPTTLAAADTVEVMDGLQACESSWHGGFSLADTILSCLYVHCPERLDAIRSPVLRAFCNGVRASVGLVRALVLQADIYEEEDFVPHHFGFDFPFAPEKVDVILKEMAAAEQWLASAADGAEDLPGLDASTREAMTARLQLRASLVQALLLIMKQAGQGASDAGAKDLRKALEDARRHLEAIRRSPAAEAAPEVPELPDNVAARVGFDAAASRRLLGSTLPRVIKLHRRAAAQSHLERTLGHLMEAGEVSGLRTMEEVVSFLERFGRQDPGVVARSAMVLAIEQGGVTGGAGASLGEFILNSVWRAPRSSRVPAKGSPRPPEGSLAEIVDGSKQCVKLFLRVLCGSRARQRRRLRHLVIEWSNLCELTHAADSAADVQKWTSGAGKAWQETLWGQRPFSMWSQRWLVFCMRKHLLLGFPLDLYSPEDYPMVYWYLETLGACLSDNLNALNDSFYTVYEGDRNAFDLRKPPVARKKPREAEQDEEALRLSVLMLDIHKALSLATLYLCLGVDRAQALPGKPAVPFNSLEQRFWQRFSLFYDLCWPSPQYFPHYQAVADAPLAAIQVLEAAKDSFQDALSVGAGLLRMPADRMPAAARATLQGWQKIAMTNIVAMGLMVKLGLGNVNLSFDFSTDEEFPTVAVRTKAQPGDAAAGSSTLGGTGASGSGAAAAAAGAVAQKTA